MDRRDGYLYGNAIRIEDKKHQVDKYREQRFTRFSKRLDNSLES